MTTLSPSTLLPVIADWLEERGRPGDAEAAAAVRRAWEAEREVSEEFARNRRGSAVTVEPINVTAGGGMSHGQEYSRTR